MKAQGILLMALAAGSLMAQESPAVDARVQLFLEYSRPAKIVVAQPSGDVSDQPDWQSGVGIRFMGEIASAPNWYYELGGMFDASSKFKINDANANLTDVKVTDSYWSVGAARLWKVGESSSFGLHLEGRGEYLRVQGEAIVGATDVQTDGSTTYLRPWVRASFDHTFLRTGQNMHPFVGLEGSAALLRTSQTRTPDFTNLDDRTVKSLAPRYSGAVYAGVRF